MKTLPVDTVRTIEESRILTREESVFLEQLLDWPLPYMRIGKRDIEETIEIFLEGRTLTPTEERHLAKIRSLLTHPDWTEDVGLRIA